MLVYCLLARLVLCMLKSFLSGIPASLFLQSSTKTDETVLQQQIWLGFPHSGYKYIHGSVGIAVAAKKPFVVCFETMLCSIGKSCLCNMHGTFSEYCNCYLHDLRQFTANVLFHILRRQFILQLSLSVLYLDRKTTLATRCIILMHYLHRHCFSSSTTSFNKKLIIERLSIISLQNCYMRPCM